MRHVRVVEFLVQDLDELGAQRFQVIEGGRIDDAETLGEPRVVQRVTRPGREVVAELRIVEIRTKETAPEMVVDAVDVDGPDVIAKLTQGLRPIPRGKRRQGAILDQKRTWGGLSAILLGTSLQNGRRRCRQRISRGPTQDERASRVDGLKGTLMRLTGPPAQTYRRRTPTMTVAGAGQQCQSLNLRVSAAAGTP